MARSRRMTRLLVLLGLVATFCDTARTESAGEPRYFVGVASLAAGSLSLVTDWEFIRSRPGDGSGTLEFFKADGTPAMISVTTEWAGAKGRVDQSENLISFDIPENSALFLRLKSAQDDYFGWARLRSAETLQSQAFLALYAETDDLHPSPGRRLQSAEIEASPEIKRALFPVRFRFGSGIEGTSFALLNLAGVQAEITLHFRAGDAPGAVSKKVTLAPGAILPSFAEDFWGLAFPTVFPLEVAAIAEVESSVPIALSVFRTQDFAPSAGVRVAVQATEKSPFDAELDSPVRIPAGEAARFNQDLIVEFWSVVDDNRCPEGAVCVWEGEAIVELRLSLTSGRKESVRLSSRGDGANRTSFEGYELQLLGILPDPKPASAPGFSEYQIQLQVTKP